MKPEKTEKKFALLWKGKMILWESYAVKKKVGQM